MSSIWEPPDAPPPPPPRLAPRRDDIVPIELTETVPPERRQRWPRRLLALATAMLLIGGVLALVLTRDGPLTTEQELARVRSFVTEAKTAKFTGTAIMEAGPDRDEPGSSFSDRSKLEGALRIPDAAHIVEDDGYAIYETLVLPDSTYWREVESEHEAELASAPWTYESFERGAENLGVDIPSDGLDPDIERAMASVSGIFTSFNAPVNLADLLRDDQPVTRATPDTLRLAMPLRDLVPDELAEMMDEAAKEFEEEFNILDGAAVILVKHSNGGRLDELIVEIQSEFDGEKAVNKSTLRFTDWGEPVKIEAPDRSDVDQTPEIDEEAVEEFGAFGLLVPARLPDEFVLTTAYVTEEDEEIEECDAVELEFAPSGAIEESIIAAQDADEDEEFSYPGYPHVTMTQTDAACEWADQYDPDLEGVTPVKVGPYSVLLTEIIDDEDSYFFAGDLVAVFEVGGAHVTVSSTLDREELLDIIASLRPGGLASLPVDKAELPPE